MEPNKREDRQQFEGLEGRDEEKNAHGSLRTDDGDGLVRGDVNRQDVGRVLEKDNRFELHLVFDLGSFGRSVILLPVLARVWVLEESRFELGEEKVTNGQVDKRFVDGSGSNLILECEKGVRSTSLRSRRSWKRRPSEGTGL